ncbi:MAG: hypothetical protein DDT32_01133 [Syntrophomonadaceae bacterium]|nr:hypothetical protein [Bacillota bacterium]
MNGSSMGNPFTKSMGNILTTLMGNVLTKLVGKVLDIYKNRIINDSLPVRARRQACLSLRNPYLFLITGEKRY